MGRIYGTGVPLKSVFGSDMFANMLSNEDLDEFFEEKYSGCGLFMNYYLEIKALFEQQFLVNAEHFCQWPKSSYSNLVKEIRVGQGKQGVYPHSLYQIIMDSNP